MKLDLKNYMEICVNQQLETIIKNLDICKCEKCINDIKAIALNDLPPKYIVTHRGEVFTKLNILEQQYETDIIVALTRAIGIVSSNPKHDEI